MSIATFIEKRDFESIRATLNGDTIARAAVKDLKDRTYEEDYGIEARILTIKVCKKNFKVHVKSTLNAVNSYHRLILARNTKCGELFYILCKKGEDSKQLFSLYDVSNI